MTESGNKIKTIKKIPLFSIGFVLLLLLAVFLLWTNTRNSNQASTADYAKVKFYGEYRIGEGEWKPVEDGVHIPATKGDVTLRGTFRAYLSEGTDLGPVEAGVPIAFYMNHINVRVREGSQELYEMDIENPILGKDACAQAWVSYSMMTAGEEPVEIYIHNPHRFGNDDAVDDFLSGLSIWSAINFERDILATGATQRNAGLMFIIIAFILLGTGLFSTLLHIKNSGIIWLLGTAVFFAGVYFVYEAPGIMFWMDSLGANTIIYGLSMMFYMLLVTGIITSCLEKTKNFGYIVTLINGIGISVCLLMPVIKDMAFYDTWFFWTILQTAVSFIMAVCSFMEFVLIREKRRWIYLGSFLPLIAFEADLLAVHTGIWNGGMASKYVFVVLLFAALVMVLRVVPESVNTAAKAKELEAEKMALDAELAQSRISTMISQIRPHFIYNTLGSIEQLCELDPPKAAELVHNFAKYLRGNFSELDNPKTIHMSQEMEHVKYYVSIENVRFPDMVFTFEMNSGDFRLPALTIQPIIENAIKHGLMKLQKGGSIHVMSYETDTDYCVEVEDDGVGFDTSILHDERKHIGLRNIRGRLEAMVGGTLLIESTIGVGTKVLIKIPKEAKE